MWTNELSPEQAEEVLALAVRAAVADGTEPLNEEARFALRNDSARHLVNSGPGGVVAYLQWEPGYRTAQLVVDPGHRRHGIGRGLVGELVRTLRGAADPEEQPGPPAIPGASPTASLADASATGGSTWGIWAFGDLPAARGFASALGLDAARGLLVMERPLDGVPTPVVPPGLSLRGFEPPDAGQFLAVNAAAFAHHPEQGALDAHGLAARMAEPWFDPSGLILAWDADGLAGFHWTKRVDRTGEVYVIGVAPRAQGRGYGRVLLHAGLDHLARAGADRVVLYVDMAEPVAVRMYESAGFRVAHRDVLYAPEHGSVQKQEQP